MTDHEKLLLFALARGETPRDAATKLAIPPKRLIYLCEDKWPVKGWYEYGVASDLGWLTDKGREMVASLAAPFLVEEMGVPK